MANDLISCDDHMDLGQLPADLWETRLPGALRGRAPHIAERDGQAVWICDGKVWGTWGGKPPATGDKRTVKPIYNAFDRGGIYDQSERRPAVAELRLQDAHAHRRYRGAQRDQQRPQVALHGVLVGDARSGHQRHRHRTVDGLFR